jgi:3-oxoacyl-[acyl-carrier-protein] synthase II
VGELFCSQLEGRSGVGLISHFDASTFPTRIAAELKNFNLGDYVSHPDRWADSGSNSRFAAAASQLCLQDAGLLQDAPIDRTRFGLYLGTGEGTQEFDRLITVVAHSFRPDLRGLDAAVVCAEGMKLYRAAREYEQELHTTTAHMAEYFRMEGPNFNCLTACAASSQAIGEAMEMIRHGDADVMLAGGSHSMIHPLGVTGFNLLTALSTRNEQPQAASRPFDLNRDGFVLGEGAGMIVLEELDHARRRGAQIYAELTGYGSTADAFRVTDSHEDGRGAIACIRGALQDANLNTAAIDYVNAHGTSTKVNDQVETLALKRVLGDHAYKIPVSSSKSMLGHLIAAAGVVELVTCVETIRRNVVPPTINYETPDPECDLDYVTEGARQCRVRHALSNSFGFGGQNISLIVSRFDG